MGKLIPIVVLKEHQDGRHIKAHAAPVVRYVNDEDLRVIGPQSNGGLTEVIEYKLGGRQFNYMTPLKPDDIEILRLPTTTDYGVLSRRAIAQAANGTTNATTLTLRQYTEVTTGTASSAEAAKLPADPALHDVICVVNNHATMTLKVFPAVGGQINSLAVNAVYDVLPGKRVFFVCTDAASAEVWKTAVDWGR